MLLHRPALVGRPRHALNVVPAEIRRIQEMFVAGLRIADIVKRSGRSEPTIYRAVRGIKRRRPHPPTRNQARDARIAHLVTSQRRSLGKVAVQFGLSKTRVCEIAREAHGLKPKRRRKSAAVKPSQLAPVSPRERRTLTRQQAGARDRLIVRLRREGMSMVRIAKRFSITKQRVHQVVLRARDREQRRAALVLRNQEIVQLARAGHGPTAIGRQMGLTKQLVQSVLSRAKGQR